MERRDKWPQCPGTSKIIDITALTPTQRGHKIGRCPVCGRLVGYRARGHLQKHASREWVERHSRARS
jgi:hypothetical protein